MRFHPVVLAAAGFLSTLAAAPAQEPPPEPAPAPDLTRPPLLLPPPPPARAAAPLPGPRIHPDDDTAGPWGLFQPFAARADGPRLGVSIETTDDGLAVTEVQEGSLAERAGVQVGDILMRVGKQPVREVADVRRGLAPFRPGQSVPLAVAREGAGIVRLEGEMPEPPEKPAPDGVRGGFLGVMLGEADEAGVLVDDIVPHSAAWFAGLQQGDRLTDIGDKVVRSSEDVVAAVSGSKPGTFVQVAYLREGERQEVRARLGPKRSSGFTGSGAFRLQGLPGLEKLHQLEGLQNLRFALPGVQRLHNLDVGRVLNLGGRTRSRLQSGPREWLRQLGRGGSRVYRWLGDELGEDCCEEGDCTSLSITVRDGQATVECDGEVQVLELRDGVHPGHSYEGIIQIHTNDDHESEHEHESDHGVGEPLLEELEEASEI